MSKQKNGSNQELVERQEQKLKEYAEHLNRLQTDIESNGALSIKHGKIALELALKAGVILLEAKDLVPKKQWENWLEENVKGITVRTAQNYRRLALEAAIEAGRVQRSGGDVAKHVSFLADCEGLREAYIVAGIIKKPKMIDEAGTPEMGPERMKKENAALYGQTIREARQEMAQRVRNQLSSLKRVTWNLSGWTIQKDKVRSVDESNAGVALFQSLINWMTFRNFSSLTPEDEIHHKAGVVLTEIFRAIILANRPGTPEPTRPEHFVMEFDANPKTPVEVAEKVPA